MIKLFRGTIKAPASKSSSLRALICSCLTSSKESIHIHNISKCDDVLAGIELVCELGDLSYSWKNEDLVLTPNNTKSEYSKSVTIDVGESGFLARAFVSIGTLFSSDFYLTGRASLLKRNLNIVDFTNTIGLNASNSKLPTKIQGTLKAREFLIKENKSSQFLSGLLCTLPLLQGDSSIMIEELVSKPYIELTLSYLECSGIKFSTEDDARLVIPGNQEYRVSEFTPETDWSSLSYIIALAIMNGDIIIEDIVDAPNLPDRVILSLLAEIGGVFFFSNSKTLQIKKSEIKGFNFDLTSNPDLAPVLVALAINASTETRLSNCYRLRDKESDRLVSIIDMLDALDVNYSYSSDTLTIYPSKVLGGVVNTYKDHRIAMTALILNAISSEKIRIDNYECINKSYPNFLKDLKILGVEYE